MPAPIKPYTKKQILGKIKQGPCQFSELAQTRRNGTPARAAARKHCDKLVADGVVLFVYLGPKQYYIFNSPEAINQAIKHQIAESSRKHESGCTAWTGSMNETRGPIMRQTLVHETVPVNVRRWLFSDLIGRELKGVKESVKMKARCHPDCIDPDHMVKKSKSQINKGRQHNLAAKLAMSKAMKAKWNKPPEAVADIRASDETHTELAKRWNMSRSNVWSIRTGRTHRLAQTPFSGLGAR